MEKIVDATVARKQLGSLLDEVFYRKDTVIIHRKGKMLAKLVPMTTEDIDISEQTKLSEQQARLLEELNSLPVIASNENPTKVLRNRRLQRQIKARKQYGI